MLNRIKSEAINLRRIHKPFSPFFKLGYRFWDTKIKVCSHQKVKVIILIVDVIIPLMTFKFQYFIFLCSFIIIYACKIMRGPDIIIILSFSSWKCKLGPYFNCFVRFHFIEAIVFCLDIRFNHFGIISSHHVIKNNICISFDTIFMELFNQLKIILFCSIFRRNRSFLIKLTQIEQIISSIADVFHT